MNESLTNGRANYLIHEHIFGECWHEWKSNSLGDRYACIRVNCFAIATNGTPVNPDYCGNISDAFTVVEKLRVEWFEANPDETYFWKFTDCCEHGWRVDIEFGHHDGDAEIADAVNESLPKAICLAALKAKGIEVNEK